MHDLSTELLTILVSALVAGWLSYAIAFRSRRRTDRMSLLQEFFDGGLNGPGAESWKLLRRAKLLFFEHGPTRAHIDAMFADDYRLEDGHIDDVRWASDMLELMNLMARGVGYRHRFTGDDFERWAL